MPRKLKPHVFVASRDPANCRYCDHGPRDAIHVEPEEVPDDESTALRDDAPAVPVPCDVLARCYRAACVLDEHGFGNEMVDEILNALTPLIPQAVREQIGSEVESDPEVGLEGG